MEQVKKLDKDLGAMKVADLVKIAEEKAKDFKYDGLKTNQIRNFYAAITKLKVDFRQGINISDQLILLKPKLAYAAGRQKAVRAKFYPFIKLAIEAVEKSHSQKQGIENFFILIESIVAYHKFYGGE